MTPMIETAFGAIMMALAIHQANDYRADVSPAWVSFTTPLLGFASAWVVASSIIGITPVITETRFDQVSIAPGEMVVRITAYKAADCNWRETEAFVIDQHGQTAEAGLEFIGDVSPGSSRPVGLIRFEPWRITYPLDIKPRGVMFRVRHSCGWMWLDSISETPVFLIEHGANSHPP